MKNQIPLFQQGEHLKQIKNNNMPLGPKQQPPYYLPEPIPTPPGGTAAIRIAGDPAQIPTSSTTETTFYIWEIPANTLPEVGDSVKIKYTGITEGAGSFNTKIYIDNVLANFLDTLLQGGQEWHIEIMRSGSTTATVYYWEQTPGATETQVQTLTSRNFANAWEIKITAQSGDSTILRSWGFTMDKYTTT